MLAAEEQHLVGMQRIEQGRETRLVDIRRQFEIRNFRADAAGHAAQRERRIDGTGGQGRGTRGRVGNLHVGHRKLSFGGWGSVRLFKQPRAQN